MSKRGADRQITKDDPTSDDERTAAEESQGGTWKAASAEELASRKIVQPRRKAGGASTGAAMPAFNFGAAPAQTKAAEPAAPEASTDAAAAASAAADAAAAGPVPAAPLNALQRLAAEQAEERWTCPTCETNNKKTAKQCGACEEPNPSHPEAAAGAPLENALTRLSKQIAASTWECQVCSTPNQMTTTKCAACDEPRPGAADGAAEGEAAASAAPAPAVGFSFGAAPSSSDAASAPAPVTFGSFGSSSGSTGGFSFGATEPSATSSSFGAVPTFSFGGGFAGSAPVTFGSVASAASGSSFGNGSAAPQFEASSAEALQAANSEISQDFKGASKESTGEEDDTVHLRTNTKVYQMKRVPVGKTVPKDLQHGPTNEVAAAAAAAAATTPATAETSASGEPGEPEKTELKYVEIGSGELHVNSFVDPNTGKTRARMVLREERTKRSVLNAPLFAQMVYQLQNDKFVRFHSLDLEGKMTTFTMKFKSKAEAQEVVQAIDSCMEMIKQ